MEVLCEVVVESEAEITQLETTMISDAFGDALEAEVQQIPALASIVLGVVAYVQAEYVGCFSDVTNRVFNHFEEMINDVKWDADSCVTACAGFAHAGVEYHGEECWCGFDVESPDKYGVSIDCADGVGGKWAIDVYTVPDSTFQCFFIYNVDQILYR